MEFFEVLYGRRAVRKYKPDPVSKEDIMKILDAANYAPSGRNLQQWVYCGQGKRRGWEPAMGVAQAYTAGWAEKARAEFIDYARTYGGAPVIIVVLTDFSEDPGIRRMNLESASAAMQNMLLAARALNLGSCWMTGPLNDEARVRQILNIRMKRK